MKFRTLKLFILIVLLSATSGKRYSGGGGSRKSGGWGGLFGSSHKTPVSRPSAPTSFNHDTGKHSSSTNFLSSESGRPSQPRPVQTHYTPSHTSSNHNSPPYPTGSHSSSQPSGFHSPSAPHQSNTNTGPVYGRPPVVHDQHQQNSAPVSHSDPYSRQPSQNPHVNAPYVPSGGYGGHIPAAPHGVSLPSSSSAGHPPYPSGLPNHPHPSPIQPQSYPSSHSAYPSPPAYQPAGPGYHPSYHSPPAYQPSYHAPPPYQPSYHSPPATQPFVPGKTVYVIPESSGRHSSGPGIGSIIAGGVAGGVAAGATNAIVDHAISSIFRPSASHVHTYPSAPPVGTPTSTSSVTNNYYYNGNAPTNADGQPGSSQPGNNQPSNSQPNSSSNNNNNNQPSGYNGQDSAGSTAQANPGVASGGPDTRTSGNPSSATNGVVSRAPETQPENPPANSGVISDENLMKFTEELFDKVDRNLNQLVDLNLQKRVTATNQSTVPDEAPEPLFNVKPELDSVPTVTSLKALYDNYQRDGTQKENVTPERRAEENTFIGEVVKTPVLSRALNWLVDQKYIESDDYEQKDLLRRMWFNNFDGTSSGFERIFLSEKFGDSGIVGMQNWIYFAHLEAQKNVDYLGYVEKLNLSGKGELLKLNYKTDGFTMQNATIFVGTPPELELALYTVCFFARPNNWCPVSLGGAKFFILTHSFRYFGKDLIDLGFPAF